MNRLRAARIAIRRLEAERDKARDPAWYMPDDVRERELAEIEEALAGLREIAQALQTEPVRRSMAAWQQDIMDGKEPVMNF